MSDSNPAALFDYVAEQLNRFGLAYLHVIEPRIKGNVLIAEGQEPVATAQLRKIFKGKIVAAGGFEPDTAEAIVDKGDADLQSIGEYFSKAIFPCTKGIPPCQPFFLRLINFMPPLIMLRPRRSTPARWRTTKRSTRLPS